MYVTVKVRIGFVSNVFRCRIDNKFCIWGFLPYLALSFCRALHCNSFLMQFFSFTKVFDVSLNKEIKIISNLDIFKRAGYSVAHDEFVPFSIKDNVLTVVDSAMNIAGDKVITVDFLKVSLLIII